MGNGLRVKYWKFRWCGKDSLANLFPVIFRLAVDPDVVVADYLVPQQGGGIFWDMDWEMDHLNRLLEFIYGAERFKFLM